MSLAASVTRSLRSSQKLIDDAHPPVSAPPSDRPFVGDPSEPARTVRQHESSRSMSKTGSKSRRSSRRESSSSKHAAQGEYEGKLNDAGKPDGRGCMQFVHGDTYDGEWSIGKMHGTGRYKLADGEVFEGTWKNGLKQGTGTTYYMSGRADVSSFDNDADTGEGVRWSPDRAMAWKLVKGDIVDEISLDEAQQICSKLKADVPPISTTTSPVLRATGGSALPIHEGV